MGINTSILEQSASLSERIYLSPTALVRVGGLPRSCFDSFRSQNLARLLDRCLQIEEDIRVAKDLLVEVLHQEVTRHLSDDDSRGAILNLKRDVYNGRAVRPAQAERCYRVASSQTCNLLKDWMALQCHLQDSLEKGFLAIESEIVTHRDSLKSLASIPTFRSGLLLSSPVFDSALDEYLASNPSTLDRKLRRTERSLLLYLIRTCYKTTPFSTLTAVCIADFIEGPETIMPELKSPWLSVHVRPNLGLLARLTSGLKRDLQRTRHSQLSLKESWSEVDGRIKYLRRTVTPVLRNGPLHSVVTEREFRIPVSASLRTLLDAFRQETAMTVDKLLHILESRTAFSRTECESFLLLLLDLDFVIIRGLRQSPFDDFWSRFTNALEKNIACANSPEVELLRELAKCAEEYSTVPLCEKREQLRSIEQRANLLLKADAMAENLPQPLIYEDSTLGSSPIELSRPAWEIHTRDLSEIQTLLPLFDPQTVSRQAMHELFVKMYGAGGRCDDILSFIEFFAEVYYRPFQEVLREASQESEGLARETPNPFALEAVTNMDRARSMLGRKLESVAKNRAGDYEVEISEEMIRDSADLLPRSEFLSHSFFCQLAHRSDGKFLVLNHTHSGMTSMYSRFCHMFESEDGSLQKRLVATLKTLQPEDSVFAELQGSHDNNLNLHPVLTETEILCPGEVGTLPVERQIRLSELSILHNTRTNRLELVCRRMDRRIVPLYLGFLHPMVLPELHRLLLHFSCVSSTRPEWRLPTKEKGTEVVFCPRLRYKSIVVERAHWRVPVHLIPRRSKGENDFFHLLSVCRWLSRHRISRRFFISTKLRTESTEQTGQTEEGIAQKPVFIDLENVFGLFLFEKIVIDSVGIITIWEQMPNDQDEWLVLPDGEYVSEYVVEITRR